MHGNAVFLECLISRTNALVDTVMGIVFSFCFGEPHISRENDYKLDEVEERKTYSWCGAKFYNLVFQVFHYLILKG